MIERTWLRFRRLPRPVQVAAWILLAPLVAAVWLWRAPRARGAARTGSVILALMSLPFYAAMFSGSIASPSSPSGPSGPQALTDQGPAATGTPEPSPVPAASDVPALSSPTPSAPPAAAPTLSPAQPLSKPAPRKTSQPAPAPTRAPTTPRTTAPPVATAPSTGCEPSYPDFCIPVGSPDLDCPEIPYTNFDVRYDVPNPDPHGFDADNDRIGCEKK